MVKHYRKGHAEYAHPLQNSRRRISRGRALSASHRYEELMARALQGLLPNDRRIYIDTPLALNSKQASQRVQTAYPDIMILNDKKNRLRGIVELKIDLGWLGDAWITKANNFQKAVKEKELSIKSKQGGNNEVKLSKNCPIITIILTEENDHGRWKKEFQKKRNVFVSLSKNKKKYPHPNERESDWTLKRYQDNLNNDCDFKRTCKQLAICFSKM